MTGVEPGGVQGDHRNVPGQGLGLQTETYRDDVRVDSLKRKTIVYFFLFNHDDIVNWDPAKKDKMPPIQNAKQILEKAGPKLLRLVKGFFFLLVFPNNEGL